MANTFKYQTEWTKEYQKSNWAMPIYPVIADFRFEDKLKVGDTVKRRYRSNPIFAKALSADGTYSPQNYVEAEESYTISKQYEASVRIVETERLHHDLPFAQSYGKQLSNAIYQEIDGDTLNAARAGAGTTLDDGSFGGTSGNGLTVSIANIANIPLLAMETYRGKNVVYDMNKKFGKLPYEEYDGMLTWIVPPQVLTVIQQYLMARGTNLGDDVTVNGYQGRFGNFNVFVSNNLPFSFRIELGATQPTDADTFTIKGVAFRLKTNTAANGDIDIGADVATTATNIAYALNNLTTDSSGVWDAFVDGTNTLSENGYTINKSDALHGISATADATGVDVVMKGTGKVTLSSTFTSANNSLVAAKQVVNSLFVVGKNVCLALRKEPSIYDNPVSGKIARDHVMWTVYDNKVFLDQARAIIVLKVRADASSFTAYSNVHA